MNDGKNLVNRRRGGIMSIIYKSPYEAYPFLSDASEDLRCDFEIYTDKVASMIGMLIAECDEPELRDELLKVEELIYHSNPTLRTKLTLTEDEVIWLKKRVDYWNEETKGRCEQFVLPCGSKRASLAHVLRAEAKGLVRLLYRYKENNHFVDNQLIDFMNLLSGYFFVIALELNNIDGVEEIPYKSRNYPSK